MLAAIAGPAGLLAVGVIGVAASVGEVRSTASAARRLVGLPALRYVAEGPLDARAADQVAAIVANAVRGAAPTRTAGLFPEVAEAALRNRPDATPEDLHGIAAQERGHDARFVARQHKRMRRDLRAALREPDARKRAHRLGVIARQEERWTRAHHEAAAARAAGFADALNVAELDPACAVWKLGPRAHHTPDCAFLHGKAIRWEALRSTRMIPPIHGGCGCRLVSRSESWRMGLSGVYLPVPIVAESLALIARARALVHTPPRGSSLEAEVISGVW